jgi:hypothetical protein
LGGETAGGLFRPIGLDMRRIDLTVVRNGAHFEIANADSRSVWIGAVTKGDGYDNESTN